MTTNPTLSNDLTELTFLALDHGIASVRASGGTLTPFLMTRDLSGEKKQLHRFVSETFEGSIAEARKMAANAGEDVQYCALAYDGFLTIEGQRADAIMVEVMERGQEGSFLFGQRYRPAKWYRRFKSIGNAAYLGVGPSLF